MAAALSGCEFIDGRAYDEQYGIPTTEAQVQSVRLQNVVAYETGVMHTVDALGGSYCIESLTSEYEERVEKELEAPVYIAPSVCGRSVMHPQAKAIAANASFTGVSQLVIEESANRLYFSPPEIQIRKSLREKTRDLIMAGSLGMYFFTVLFGLFRIVYYFFCVGGKIPHRAINLRQSESYGFFHCYSYLSRLICFANQAAGLFSHL